jgi:hypothetical protein
MTRLLVLGLLLVILWLGLKNVTLQIKTAFLGENPGRRRPPAPSAAAETLLRCVHCGTYFAASRVLKGAGEEVFCSEECRGAGAKTA